MIEKLKYASFRASIFIPKVPYNAETLQKLLPKFNNFVPSVIRPTLEVNGVPLPNVEIKDSSWELISTDNRIHILFLDSKVDVLIHLKEVYSLESLKVNAEKAFECIRIITDVFSLPASRIALAPTFIIEDVSDKELGQLASSVFKTNSYKNGRMTNASFTNVFRVEENLCAKNYIINYNIKLKIQNQLKNIGNGLRISNNLVAELDINTLPQPQYRFDNEEMLDFYTKSPNWTDDFIRFYLKQD